MVLIVEKGVRDRICPAIHRYVKANNKYTKNYGKNKGSLYLKYWDINNLCRWAMSQKLSVDSFMWVKETSQFDKDLIKSYNEDSNIGYFLKLMFNILRNCMNFIMVYLFRKSLKTCSQLT